MSVMTVRGGIPWVLRDAAVPVAGRLVNVPFLIHFVIARNKGGVPIRLYFTAKDMADDVNYVEVPVASATYPYGEWAGPVETSSGVPGDGHDNLWIKAIGGAGSIELVAFQRRG